jgi:beta-1,4-N-acetylglucosaminyltransferase
LIFVTVGAHYRGFERLVKKMDEIAGKIEEKVIIQIGSTDYKPSNAEFFNFASFEEVERLSRAARVIVSHGGTGSILTALEEQKPLIVVPRLKEFNEHLNNHQLELTEALSQAGKIVAVYDVSLLEEALTNMERSKFIKIEKDMRLINFLKDYLTNIKNNNDALNICLTCSHGGHLTDMKQLMRAFEGHSVFFVTYRHRVTMDLKKKYCVKNFGKNPVKLFASFPKMFRILLHEKPDVIVSTGAEIAIPIFYAAWILGIKTMFIECSCRVKEPSWTAKIVYPVAGMFLVQWKQLLPKLGKKAQYQGGLY